ncbi:MAG: hypothetical protein ABIL24_05280 [candidate division WOR-3 bacterium]
MAFSILLGFENSRKLWFKRKTAPKIIIQQELHYVVKIDEFKSNEQK